MIGAANQWGGVWLEYFGVALVQNTVFLGIVFLALYLARNTRASTRYVIAITGLVKLLLPPFLPVYLAAESGAEVLALSGVSYMLLSGSAPSGEGPAAAAQQAPLVTLAGGLFAVWAVIACAYVLLAAVSTLRLTVLLRGAVPSGPVVTTAGRSRGLSIYKSDRIAAPLIVSLLPRRIYVPASWDTWPEECRRAALEHELAHTCRHDGLVRVIEIVVQAVYFFHPLVWLLSRRISEYREMACDDASVAMNRIGPHEYSRQLLRIAQSAAGHSPDLRAAAALFGSRSELMKRIKYQLKEDDMPHLTKRTRELLIAALIVFILPLSWYCGEVRTDADEARDSQTAAADLPECLDRIEVYVGGDKIEVEGQPTDLAGLAEALKQKVSHPDSTIVVLRSDDRARMGLVHKIHVVLTDLGLVRVMYAGRSGEGLPLTLPVPKVAERLASLPQQDLSVIDLNGSGEISVRGAKVEKPNLRARVEDEVARNESVVFSIRPASDASFDDFLEVLAQTKAGGATRIAIEKPM